MPQALADGGLSWWGVEGQTGRMALCVLRTELEHVATSHSCQRSIPRLSRWAGQPLVLVSGHSHVCSNRTRTASRPRHVAQ